MRVWYAEAEGRTWKKVVQTTTITAVGRSRPVAAGQWVNKLRRHDFDSKLTADHVRQHADMGWSAAVGGWEWKGAAP